MSWRLAFNVLKREISSIFYNNKYILKPNFLIPGTARSGSTTLYFYLKQHPEIYFSKMKEPSYFSNNYDLGEEWYLSNFKSPRDFPAIGEASTTYFISEIVTKRIYKFNPNFKLIFILRDPVERLYSAYKSAIHFQGEFISFEKRICANNNQSLKYGKYFTHINRFLKYFPEKNVFFIFFEKFIENPEKHLRDLCEFLGVNSKFKFDSKKIYRNKSKVPLSLKLQQINAKFFRPNHRGQLIKRSIKYGTFHLINYLNWLSKTRKFPEMNEKTRLYLKRYYQEEIENLEKLINVELNAWKL